MKRTSIIRRPFVHRMYNVTIILIGLNLFVFLLQYLSPRLNQQISIYLGLIPDLVITRGFFWQVFTYMFVHGSMLHILFNMLALFIFGMQLERQMGSSEFLLLYLFCGIGTGLISLLLGINVVGASGAIYGLLLAFATYFPRSRILIFYVMPVPAPIAVGIFVVLSIVFQITGTMGGVAHWGHLAGIVLAYLYFLVRMGINPIREFLDSR